MTEMSARQIALYRSLLDAAPDPEQQLPLIYVYANRHGASEGDVRVVKGWLEADKRVREQAR